MMMLNHPLMLIDVVNLMVYHMMNVDLLIVVVLVELLLLEVKQLELNVEYVIE
jgi:hypothetical protein